MLSFSMWRRNGRSQHLFLAVFQIFSGSLSPVPQHAAASDCVGCDMGSHMSNSATQFCNVLTGTMIRTRRAAVWRRKTSMNEITCSVLPSPMLCAKMQPRPLLIWHRCSDSTTLSYRNRIPPIYHNHIITHCALIRFKDISWNCFDLLWIVVNLLTKYLLLILSLSVPPFTHAFLKSPSSRILCHSWATCFIGSYEALYAVLYSSI